MAIDATPIHPMTDPARHSSSAADYVESERVDVAPPCDRARWVPSMRTVGSAAAVVTSLAMIATPLNSRAGAVRRVLSTVVVGGHFVTTAVHTMRRWGVLRGSAAAGTVSVGTAVVERFGSRHGVPFGRYHYTEALRPQIAGVPAIVPLAWFGMAVPARETAHAALGRRSGPARRIVLGSVALTAWDLFLDPQMVGEGYWRWARNGLYRGIPVTNFVGWLVTGFGVMAALEVLTPVSSDRADPALVGEYAFMATMETLGFAAFFKDRTVATVGGAAMLPLAVTAMWRLWRARR